MAKSIKLTTKTTIGQQIIEKPVFFNADNILYYEGFSYDGNTWTTLTLIGTTSANNVTYNVVESPEDIHKLINQ